jgi:putative phosphoribosyl transferase
MPTNLDSDTFLFLDREDAANELLDILPKEFMKKEDWILLALSSGSVKIVDIISKELDLDFDLLFMAAIYAPNNDECQIAKVSENEEIVIHQNLVDSFGISLDYIYGEAQRKYQDDLLDCQYRYRKSLGISNLKNRNVLLVDEGCETGLRAVCALKAVLALGAKKVSLATPVIAEDLYHNLDLKLDKIYTNHVIKDFIRVEYYYERLEELKKKEVKKILEKNVNFMPFKGEK